MVTDYTPPPWDEALYSFVQHLKGTPRAEKTVEFYQYLLSICVHYAEDANIPPDKFGKRSLNEYLVWRQENGHCVSGNKLSLTTLHSSAGREGLHEVLLPLRPHPPQPAGGLRTAQGREPAQVHAG